MSEITIPIRSSLEELLRNTIDSSIDMIQVFKAERDDQNEIVDFTWILNNKASEAIYGDVIGKSLLTLHPGVIDEGIFQTFKKVVETGQPDQLVRHYVHEQFNGWFHQSTVKQNDGVVTTTKNITDIQQAETQLVKSTALLQSVLSNTSSSIMLLRPLYNDDGKIIDFEYRYINEHALKSVSRKGLVGKSFTQEFPGLRGSALLQHYIDVVIDNSEWSGETHINFDGFDVWSQVYAKKLNGDLLVTYFDITSKKKAEQEILQLKDEIAQRAEDKYRTLFNSIDEGFVIQEMIYDAQGKPVDIRVEEANAAHQKLTGLGNLVGKSGSDFAITTEQYWFDKFDNVVKTGEPLRFENWHEATKRWYDVFASRVGGNGSAKMAVVFNDVTERKRREASQAYFLRLNDALRFVGDPLEVQRVAMQTLGEHLNVDRVVYVGRDGHEFVLNANYVSEGVQKITGRFPFDGFGNFAEMLQRGQNVVVDDVSLGDLDEAEKQNFLAFGIHAIVAVPLIKDGQFVANLGIHHQTPRHWRDDEVALIQETAERTWAAVEVAKAENALVASEEKYRSIFESIDEGFTIQELLTDENDNVIDIIYREANKAFEHHTGVKNVVGKKASEFTPHLEQQWLDAMTQVYKTGEPLRAEGFQVDLDRWITLQYARVGGPGSKILSVVFQDITERKRREQQQQFLIRFTDALRSEPDADAMANRAIRMLAEHLQLDRCYVGIALLDDDREIFPYQYGNNRVPPMPEEGVRLSDFPEALRKTFDETLVITDFQNTEGLSETEKQNFAALGFGAVVVANARKGDKNPDWSINAVSATSRRWTDIEIQLIEEATERTWATVKRARAKEALRQSEANFRTLSDAVPQIIWVNDEYGKAVYFNKRWFQYTGLSFEQSAGGGWLYTVHPDDAIASEDRWKAALQKGETFDANYRLRRHDGKYCWHLARNVPLKSDNGDIIGWFGSATDIEDLKRTEQVQQEFIGIASHELKTPLTSIISYVELITEMLEEQGIDYLMKLMSKLTVQVGRMANLINQLLDITRLEHGRLKYNKTNFDIRFLVTDVAEEVLTIAGSRKINLNTDQGAMVMADAERIRQVLVNLISNAVKYSNERTNINVSMQVDKNSVTVAVADQGSGIASDDLPHVFEKFFRGKTHSAGGAAGIGLGLFISSEIIKDHGGSILVESEEGRGSTFKFILPTYSGLLLNG